jgi:hypothetical protein
MKALEVENITKFIQAKQMIMQMKAQNMQMWLPTDEYDKISDRLDILFNIDKENVDIKSNEQEVREISAQLTQLINSFNMWWMQNEQANMMATPQMDFGGQGEVQGAETQQPAVQQTI